MSNDVKLLSPASNCAVVQSPERKYPGVVFQGDSLSILIGDLKEALRESDLEEKEFGIRDVIERLFGVQSHYEEVLAKAGIKRPY